MDIDPWRAQRLLQAIVTQALVDATAKDAPFSKKPLSPLKRKKNESAGAYHKRMADRTAAAMERRQKTANRPRTEAREWLLRDMESFPSLVSLAGYNATDVRERARKLERDGWPRRVSEERLAA